MTKGLFFALRATFVAAALVFATTASAAELAEEDARKLLEMGFSQETVSGLSDEQVEQIYLVLSTEGEDDKKQAIEQILGD